MSGPVTIALAGNPNAGKTTLFNALTGARQHVGNYPGVTVEKKEGEAHLDGEAVHVVDLPGTYSLTAYSLEELVARNFIIGQRPDVVVDVVDASNLERNLYLAVQLLELGVPLVICLNMVDMAERRGLAVDAEKLSEHLGVPVVPTVARHGKGVADTLRAAVEVARQKRPWQPLEISYGPDMDLAIDDLKARLEGEQTRQGLLSARWLAIKLLEGDSEVMNLMSQDSGLGPQLLPVQRRMAKHMQDTTGDDPECIIADYRYGFINAITRKAVTTEREVRLDMSDKLDQVLTSRFFGPLFLLAVLYGVYQFVFLISQEPVVWLEAGFGWLGDVVSAAVPEGVIQSLLVSGVIDGVGGVLGFAPLILFMFLAIAFLEDTGYMARVAYLLDRVLRAFGLHGSSVLALIVSGGISGGCAVPGIMATRTLKDPKARLATILVAPMMNCGAKLPVYAVLTAAFFPKNQAMVMFGLTLLSWALALVAAKVMRATVLKGEQSPFVMELPPYRLPTFKGLMIHTWERTWQYVKKAGTLILLVSLVIWAMMSFPAMPADEAAHFDGQIAAATDQDEALSLSAQKSQAGLMDTVAGRLGRALTYVTDPLGFDWRVNVALLGGFAAKEVIISTLGTAYSLVEDGDEGAGLSQRLAKNPQWNPLKAFALMVFVMIYSPCFVTIVTIRRETGTWGWAFFAMAYTTATAYALALVIYQGGRILGLG